MKQVIVWVVLTMVLVGCLRLGHAFMPFTSPACLDCRFRPVGLNEEYFDGCNQCVCTSLFPPRAACTYRACPYNECFKGGRRFFRGYRGWGFRG